MAKPKEIIKTVFIIELADIVEKHPYIAFALIGIGIEFLGKCLDMEHQDWAQQRLSKAHFNNAIEKLDSLRFYEQFLNEDTFFLYSTLRCGFAHSMIPQHRISNGKLYGLGVCSKTDSYGHMLNVYPNKEILTLKIEFLFADFVNACNEVIRMNFPVGDKMNKEYLSVGRIDNTDIISQTCFVLSDYNTITR